jgi:two-component system cell cycle response regulator DivK
MSENEILVVDDNSENLILIELLLACENFNVRTADGAANALAALAASLPDAMLTDIQMPDVDGLELIRQVRSNPQTSGICILAVSANAMKENIQEAYAAGCDAYITKPLDTRTFAHSVRTQMEHGRHQRSGNPEMEAFEERPTLYRELCADCTRQIEPLLATMDDTLRRQRACGILHQCAGISGVLGHPHITALALHLEKHSDSLNQQDFLAGLRKLSDMMAGVQRQPEAASP